MGLLCQSMKMHLAPRRRHICLRASLAASAGSGGLESRDLGKLQGPTHPPTSKAYGESLDEHREGSCWEFDPPLGRREDIDAWKRCKMTMMTFSQGNWISGNRTSRNVGKRSRGGSLESLSTNLPFKEPRALRSSR
ncbi:hypothetical protein CPC08DRAFT_527678 [Agrocybe pediades]|nr:hypothetical protein CPC08DRAFT_527678 [Agrocybe pediades]